MRISPGPEFKPVIIELNSDDRQCKPIMKGDLPLNRESVTGYLSQLLGWKRAGNRIVKTYEFKDYYRTIGFVNALAFIANREDHHPDLEVGYKTCKVSYSTHEVDGLTENDFICAAKIDGILVGSTEKM